MSAYKVLHPDKTQATIFSSDSNVEKSGGRKMDLDAMEIDKVKKKKGRVYDTVKYVQAKASKVKQSHIIQ